MKNETLLTVTQAAKRKGISRTTIYNAIADGRLPAQMVLGRTAIRERDLMKSGLGDAKRGRAAGKPISSAHKKAIGAAQKKRWQLRRNA